MAMEFSAALTGLDQFYTALAGLDSKVAVAGREAVATASMMLIADAMGNFTGAHGRREPRVPNSARQPNIVTGNLRRSIRSTGVIQTGRASFQAEVGPTAEYGRAVELGYGNRGAYPFFGPAAKRVRQQMPDISTVIFARYIAP